MIDPPITSKNLCVKCPRPGCCCHQGIMVKGQQLVTDHACPFLSEKGRCTIYMERHRNADCLTIEEMIAEGTVPKWCPYVKDDAAYQARTGTRLYDFKIMEVKTT